MDDFSDYPAYTWREAALIFGVNAETLRDYGKKGFLPFITRRIEKGRTARLSRLDILRLGVFLELRTLTGKQQAAAWADVIPNKALKHWPEIRLMESETSISGLFIDLGTLRLEVTRKIESCIAIQL